MRKKIMTLTPLLLVLLAATHTCALTITGMDSAANLARAMVGSGVSISNVSYTGSSTASGYFTGGLESGLDFNEGIVLTSGSASNFDGTSNTSDNRGTNNGLAGNASLDGLVSSKTFDAAVLSFDFVSEGTSAYFNYIFGSDEYNEYVDSFNDVFGFFFNGQNIALVPGTGIPVSINNVNAEDYSEYYNDNDNSSSPGAFANEMDGFTTAFTASLEGLTVGTTYHIELAIADVMDYELDSAVFLQSGSFSNTTAAPVPEPASLFLLGSGLLGLVGAKKKKAGR